MKLALALLISLTASTATAVAVLWPSTKTTKTNRFNYDRTEEAREVSGFWSKRKMGVGLTTAGAYGLLGGVVSINFHPQWGVDLGYGGGSHFQSFGFRVKKTLLKSSPLNPYLGMGFNRWQRVTTRPFDSKDVSPGYVAREFLSDEERRNSDIDEKLVSGVLGIQYTFTNGTWEGYGFFLEGLLLMSTEDFKTAPTASLGFNYFF